MMLHDSSTLLEQDTLTSSSTVLLNAQSTVQHNVL